MRRRGSGEGSIVERTKLRRDGTVYRYWQGSIMVGYRPDGKRDIRTVTGRTRQEVVAKLAALVSKKATGRVVQADRLTVRQYLTSWLEYQRQFGGRDGDGLRPNTYRNYETVIRLHVLPVIGDLPLQKVTADHLKALYRTILSKRRLDKNRPLSVRIAEMAHNILHKAFKDAVQERKLEANPCDFVANPPRTRYRVTDAPVLEKDQARAVLERVRDTRYYLPFLVAMATGARRNEVLGLCWDDIDFEAGVIHIRQQWGKRKDGTWGLVPPKTEAGVRDVPVPAEVLEALAAHRIIQQAQGLGPLVFDRGDGRPIPPEQWNAAWAKVRKELGLPERLRLHDLRGSYITWQAEAGTDIKTVSQIVGHADPKVTWLLYQRVTRQMADRAARAVAGLTGHGTPAEGQAPSG